MERWTGIVLCFALAFVACTSPEERFREHLARGDAYVEKGETQNALLEYHSALKVRPDDADLNERVGDLLLAQGSPQDAAFFFREAHRLEPERLGAALKEARALLPSDPVRARRLVLPITDEQPENAFAQRTLSELELALQRHESAEAAAERAVELAPDDPQNWVQLGNVRAARVLTAQMNQAADDALFESALDAFARADAAAGGLVAARIDRGRLFAAWGGHREEAEQSFRAALDLAGQQGDEAARLAAAQELARQARRWGDPELETEALRLVVGLADDRIEAWTRLAALAGSPEKAGQVYTQLLSRRADDPEAHSAYTTFLIQTGRSDAAIAHLEESIEDGVESPALWEQLLILHVAKRRFADARATVVRMADTHPDHPLTTRARARLALATGRPQVAAETLRELVLQEEDPDSQLLLALAEYRTDHLGRARAAVDRAIAQSPVYRVAAARLKSRIHYDAGEWKKTLSTLDGMSARGHPLNAADQMLRAVALYETGDAEAGRATLVRSLESDPRARAALYYLEREGARDPEGARRYMEAAHRRDPMHQGLLSTLTERDLEAGRRDEARARLNAVIENHPARHHTLLLRADLLARSGDWEEAEADAMRAFEAAPHSSEALELLFRIYVDQDKVAEARRSFREADEAGVLHAGARLLMGRLALYEGDTGEARRTYERVVEENPELASAASDLAYLLAEQGEDLDRALELATSAREKLVTDPGAAHHLGYVYLQAGRPEEALTEFENASRLSELSHVSQPGPALDYHRGLALRALERDNEAIEAFESALANGTEFPEAADARRALEAIRAASS